MVRIVYSKRLIESKTKLKTKVIDDKGKKYLFIEELRTIIDVDDCKYSFCTKFYAVEQSQLMQKPLLIEFEVRQIFSGLNFWLGLFSKPLYVNSWDLKLVNLAEQQNQMWGAHIEGINGFFKDHQKN